jgi:hypothetical protein
MVNQSTYINKDQNKILFYNASTKKYFFFKTQTESLEELNISDSEDITYAITDGVGMVYLTKNEEAYYLKF